MTPQVFVMTKAAVLGRVKTRLGREVGPVEALRVYRATRRAVLLRLMRDRRFVLIYAVDPAPHRDRSLPVGRRQVGQCRGDLGQRMTRLLAMRMGGAPRLVIGTDIPGVTGDKIAVAFRRLAGARAVIGPAEDGGFWLYGTRPSPTLMLPFARVRWSQAETLADVLTNIPAPTLRYAATLSDIDTRDDYLRHRASLGRVVRPRLARSREV